MGRFLTVLHAISLYVELSLVIYVLTLLDGESWQLVLGLLIASLILCNFVSAVRVNQTMDFYRKPCNLFYCIIFHFLQMGLLWRYVKLVIKFNPAHSRDMMKLKLLHNCIVSVPVLLYLSLLYLQHGALHHEYMTVAVTCFISVCLTLSHFSDFQCRDRTDYGVFICALFWKVFMLFSRFSAIVWALSGTNGLWAAFILGVHFIVLMIWNQLRDQSHKDCSGTRIWLILLAVANTLDMTLSEYKTSIHWLIGFYSLMLGENVAMIGVAYSSLERPHDLFHTLWLMAVFASFSAGLLLSLVTMTLCAQEKKTALQMMLNRWCSCCQQDENDAAFLWDAYDTKRKPTGYSNKAFVIEDKQKHVDILNNPLGVSDIVSLTTAATTGPATPTDEVVVVESPSHTDHLKRPLANEKQVTGKF